MAYLLHILIITAIYVILAVSLDLLAGHAGLLSVAQAAFYGLGAYTSALLTVKMGATFLVGIITGMLLATVLSLLVSLPSLRLSDDYFVIASFAFQMIVFSILNNWGALTGGPTGIPGIPAPGVFGGHVLTHAGFLMLAATCAVLSYLVVWRLGTGPYGRVLHAMREDEVLAKALGKGTVRFKVTIFAASTALSALAGSLYAHYVTYIDPTSFTVMESILVISMVIIGGAGSLWGPPLGAAVLVSLPELLRSAGLPSAAAANLRQIIYGGMLVFMMMFRPRGLVGCYSFGR
ncbi:MAG: branched-chain amino acid ABC transporter permease [Phycisphaerae bacterium]|nr:branched-chain amino acid ABC transporter permease [Phycisphaerae bacterium]